MTGGAGAGDGFEEPWTTARGLRDAARYLLVVGIVSVLVLGGALSLLGPWLGTVLPTGQRGSGTLLFLLTAPVWLTAPRLLWDRLIDRAGFVSRILAVAGVLTAALIAALGVGVPYGLGLVNGRIASSFGLALVGATLIWVWRGCAEEFG